MAKLLEQKNEGFTDVEAISEELPSVSRAAAYQAIKPFLETGVVCKIPTMDGAHVYSLTRVSHRNHHSISAPSSVVGISRRLQSVGRSGLWAPIFRDRPSTTALSCT